MVSEIIHIPRHWARPDSSSYPPVAQRLERERPSCSSGWRDGEGGERTRDYRLEREEFSTRERQTSWLLGGAVRNGRRVIQTKKGGNKMDLVIKSEINRN